MRGARTRASFFSHLCALAVNWAPASVPIPKFATPCSTLDANFGIERTLAKPVILVPL
jgi:hypothetical protein